jgi:hypothetical protein
MATLNMRQMSMHGDSDEATGELIHDHEHLVVNAKHVVHSGDSGNNGGYHTNPVLLEGLPNEISW